MKSSLPPPIPRHVEIPSNDSWGPSQWISVSFAGLMFLFLVTVVVLLIKDGRSRELAQQGEAETQSDTSLRPQQDMDSDDEGAQGEEITSSSGEDTASASGEVESEDNEPPPSESRNFGTTGSPLSSDSTRSESQQGQPAPVMNNDSPTTANNRLEEFALRVNREGGETGEIQVTLIWNSLDDLDLYVVCPSGETISFENTLSQCGGELDIDMNASRDRSSTQPVENIFWKKRRFPSGKYRVFVHNYYSLSGNKPTNFKLGVKIGDEKELLTGSVSPEQKQLVTEFSVP